MKLNRLLLVLVSSPCLAEVFYYGNHYLTVDVRSDQASILKFENVPLSSSCQPGLLRFEPLDEKALNLGDQQRIQDTVGSEAEKDTTISQLIRVTPQSKTGVVTCSFTLAGGGEVPVRFNLTEGIARPLIDLRPLAEKYAKPQVNNELGILQSLLKGDSIYLHDSTKDYTCSGPVDVHSRDCRHLIISNPSANYDLTYVGTDMSIKAWTWSVTLKESLPFVKIADLNARYGGGVLYSAVSPQKEFYQKGDQLKHFIITSAQVTALELREVLP